MTFLSDILYYFYSNISYKNFKSQFSVNRPGHLEAGMFFPLSYVFLLKSEQINIYILLMRVLLHPPIKLDKSMIIIKIKYINKKLLLYD